MVNADRAIRHKCTPATAIVLALAAVAHALGWLLPVIEDYRGWQAFRVAFSPVWPYESFEIDSGGLLVLSVASALTNAVFLVLWVALITGFASTLRRAKTLVFVAAALTLLDLHWPLSTRGAPITLESGYFVWVGSFAALALAAFLEVRAARRRALRSPA
jgi:hypothetical protein